MRRRLGPERLALFPLAVVLLLTPLLAVARPQPASAAGEVTECTEAALRAALEGGGQVSIVCSGVIPLTSQLEITEDTRITGFVTLDGQGMTRLIHVSAGVTVDLVGLTLVNGNGNGGNGGAIYNEGTLTLASLDFSDNFSAQQGGAIFNDAGSVTIFPSVLGDNRAGVAGGAISNVNGTVNIFGSLLVFNDAGQTGGAIHNDGDLLIDISDISINKSGGNGDENSVSGGAGGAIANSGNAVITASTFDFNRSEVGGAIDNVLASATITASTFAGNSATMRGGAISNSGELTLTFDTFSGNSSSFSGAVLANLVFGFPNPAPMALLSANILNGRAGVANCDGPGISSGGYNVGSDAGCNLTAPGDAQNANPLLGPLAGNGGVGSTFMPQAGSPAIDRVPNDVCVALAAANNGLDQRGVPRPDSAGLPCDSGSLELQLHNFFCVGERSGSLRYVSVPNGCVRGEQRLMQSANGRYLFCIGERSGTMRYSLSGGCQRGEQRFFLPLGSPITICVGERSRSVRFTIGSAQCNPRGEIPYIIVNPFA